MKNNTIRFSLKINMSLPATGLSKTAYRTIVLGSLGLTGFVLALLYLLINGTP